MIHWWSLLRVLGFGSKRRSTSSVSEVVRSRHLPVHGWRYLLALILSAVTGQLCADSMLIDIDAQAEQRIKARFDSAGLHYPPERVQLVAIKQSRLVEVWVWQPNRSASCSCQLDSPDPQGCGKCNGVVGTTLAALPGGRSSKCSCQLDTPALPGGRWWHLHDYPVFAASGHAGPKLREGDLQVPEGFYRVEALNPNSHFHLSLKLDYPNPFDWVHALEEGRTQPGSNIFIHGSAWSVGCLAMGNQGVEEFFTLAARIGAERMHVLIAPYDFRAQSVRVKGGSPDWVGELYGYIKSRLGQFPLADKRKTCEPECRIAADRLIRRRLLSELPAARSTLSD